MNKIKMNENRMRKSMVDFNNEGKKEAIANNFTKPGSNFKEETQIFNNFMGFSKSQ